MNKEKFPLTHVVLYAKGWYKTTDNIWDDFKEILKLDNYTPFNNNDVYSILLSRVSEYECNEFKLRNIMMGILPSECWKVNYDPTEYNVQTAFLYYVLSTLRFLDNKGWKIGTPKYKLYPKNPNITTKQVIDMFNK